MSARITPSAAPSAMNRPYRGARRTFTVSPVTSVSSGSAGSCASWWLSLTRPFSHPSANAGTRGPGRRSSAQLRAFDPLEVLLGHGAGHVLAREAGQVELGDRGALGDGGLQVGDLLIDHVIGAEFRTD